MSTEKDQLIKELNELIDKPGGKRATRFVLNSLGAVPIIGGIIAASGAMWGEEEQHQFNEKITEWASQADVDMNSVLKVLESQLREPTKANLSLLFGEVLGIDLPDTYPPNGIQISTILHGESISEFRPYVVNDWITITPNHNTVQMGSGNIIGDSIEDRKRPWGLGSGYILNVSKLYYD